ncbi:MAG: RHS repeat protein [Anaerolineae bacterium]|nr:RHS repeat protein [Anaerolineae bacterium]
MLTFTQNTYTLTQGDNLVYTFNQTGTLTGMSDSLGHTTSLAYTNGNLTTIQGEDGRALTLTYDLQKRIKTIQDPLLRTAIYTYTDSALTAYRAPNGQVWTYVYSNSLMTALTAPNGGVLAHGYDAQMRVVTQTNPLGASGVISHGDGLTAIRDANGNFTYHTYNESGALSAVTDATGRTVTYTRDLDQNSTGAASDDARSVSLEWNDCACSPTVVTDTLGQVTQYSYDGENQLTEAQDALGHVTRYAYDGHRPITITDALSGTVVNTYNDDNLLVQTVDHGLTTTYGYDTFGQLIAVTNTLGQAARYGYDAAGRLITTTNPAGQVTVNEYDVSDRLLRVTENYTTAGGQNHLGLYNQVTTYAYGHADAWGHSPRAWMTDTHGQVTRYEYDLLGRVARVDYPANGDVAAFSVDHAYDALGRRAAMTETASASLTSGLTTWSYNALGRVLRVSDPFTGVVEYGYDSLGNRTALTVTAADSELRITNYEFDAVNRLVRVSDWATGTAAYGYDAAGRILTETLPNGVMTAYGYDGAGRQVSVQHQGITGTLATYTYTLDSLGRQIGVDESLRAGAELTVTTRAITHTFDGAGRLAHSAYSTGESFAYEYDAAGNRTAITDVTPLSGALVTTQSYDAANRLSARSRSDGHNYLYAWSQQGQLLAEYTQGVPARTFVYDGAGRMVEATVFTLTTEFAYNGLGARLSLSVAGQTTRYTLDYAAGNRILVETTPTETVTYLYGRECLGEQRNDTWLYYLHDLTGHVRQGADANGAVTGAWLFDPDGTVLEGPDGPVSHLICTALAHGVYDRSTGLIYQNGRSSV